MIPLLLPLPRMPEPLHIASRLSRRVKCPRTTSLRVRARMSSDSREVGAAAEQAPTHERLARGRGGGCQFAHSRTPGTAASGRHGGGRPGVDRTASASFYDGDVGEPRWPMIAVQRRASDGVVTPVQKRCARVRRVPLTTRCSSARLSPPRLAGGCGGRRAGGVTVFALARLVGVSVRMREASGRSSKALTPASDRLDALEPRSFRRQRTRQRSRGLLREHPARVDLPRRSTPEAPN